MAIKALPPAKINPTKLLGGLSSSIKKISASSLRDESTGISKNNLIIIRTQVIKIKDLIQSTTLLKSAEIERKRKESEKEKFGKEEEKLETKKEPGTKKLNVPGLPKLGFLDRLKNFIFNTLLGYFVYKLIPYTPQLINFVKIAAPAFDFLIDMSGKLLNGMVSFIDAGYKAVDATRGLVGKTFGEDALKNFDKLTGDFKKFMNLAIIVGMASADFGMDRLGRKLTGKGAERAAEKGAGTLARRGAGRVTTRAGARIGGKFGAKIGSKAFKAIPLLGAGLAIVEGIMRIKDGDYVGGLLSFGSAIPVAGWAFLALDIAREFMGGQEFDKSVGKAFGGTPGLTDKQVQQRQPSMSGPSFMGVAGGGPITRGGKIIGGVKRGVTKTKVTRGVKVEPPTLKPGAAVGGEKQIEKIFPETDKKDTVNPGGYIKKSYDTLGTAPFFGPLLAIATKVVAGEKPSAVDYKNAGQGLSGWINNTFGNSGSGFAGGGEVGPGMFNEDMTNVIAKSVEDSISPKIDAAIQDLMKNLMLKPSEEKKEQPPGTEDDFGGSATEAIGGARLLMAAGFPSLSAAVLSSIIQAESTWKGQRTPWVLNDGAGTNKGLISWNRSRITNAEKFLGKPLETASNAEQIKWIKEELKQYGLLDEFMNPQSTEEQLKKAGYAYVGWDRRYDADHWKNIANIRSALEKGEMGSYIAGKPGMTDLSGVQYITGDPSSPNYAPDHGGPGYAEKYHDHLSFKDRATAERAYNFFSKRFKVTEFKGFGSGVTGPHSGEGSLHHSGLAFDIPGYQWGGKPGTPAGPIEWKGSAKVRNALAEFQSLKAMAKGGLVRGMTRAIIGEKGPEFVLDSNTTSALENTFPGFLNALNKANYNDAIQVLRDYASYESGSEEQIVVEQPAPEIVYLPMPMPMGSGIGFGGGGSSPDSDYDMTYMNA
jgi:hypothetical protein